MNRAPASLITYNLLQLIALPAAPLFLLYLASRKKYRSQILQRMGLGISNSNLKGKRPTFWIHALSVGELNAATPLIEAILTKWPDAGLVCSSTTATGTEALQKRFEKKADILLRPPFDFWITVKKSVDAIKPDIFILTETDVWPNWLWYLKKRGTYMIFANASLSSKAARKIQKSHSASLLYGSFDIITPQSKDDLARFSAVGVGLNKLKFLGNLKYDRKMPHMPEDEKKEWRKELGLSKDIPILVFGSTHPGEEEIILQALAELYGHIPFQAIIAPRKPERGREVARIASRHGFDAALRSLGQRPESGAKNVIILDTLGELLKCYGVAHIAFVGGSLVNIGGHNLLEAAHYRIPVLFGPYVESTRDVARALLKHKGGMEISTSRQLKKALAALLSNKVLYDEYGASARRVAEEFSGSLSKHINLIEEGLKLKGFN